MNKEYGLYKFARTVTQILATLFNLLIINLVFTNDHRYHCNRYI